MEHVVSEVAHLCHRKRPEYPSHPAGSFVKLRLMDQVRCVPASWDVLQEEGEDHFSTALKVGGEGRQRWINVRQVELGMGWP